MNIKNSVAAIACVGTLAVGYIAGAYIGAPFSDGALLSGNVKRANVYNKAVSPEMQSACEQLASDTILQQQTAVGATLMYSRIMRLDELANNTLDATKDIEQLAGVHDEMEAMTQRTGNALDAIEEYMKETASVFEGEQPAGYEQTQNNAQLAYMVMERALDVCPQMVDQLMAYLADNHDAQIADLSSQWILYCNESAFLANSTPDKEYWTNEMAKAATASEQVAAAINKGIGASHAWARDNDALKNNLNVIKDDALGSITKHNGDLGAFLGTNSKQIGGRGFLRNSKELLSIGQELASLSFVYGAVIVVENKPDMLGITKVNNESKYARENALSSNFINLLNSDKLGATVLSDQSKLLGFYFLRDVTNALNCEGKLGPRGPR